MFLGDYHCHSAFSSDGSDAMESLCEAAAERGITEIAVTDHCDMGGPFDEDGHYNAYLRAAESNKDVRLLYAIELGEAIHDPERARRIVSGHPYDFIIGSYHALKGERDFYCLEYPDILTCRAYIERYLEELWEHCGFGGFDVLGHLTYPLRYMRLRDGIDIDFSGYRCQTGRIFRYLAEHGMGIELNMSGLRTNKGFPMPDLELLCMYRQAGGEIVTVGSDAHRSYDIGLHIRDGYELLRQAGFRFVTSFCERRPNFEALY